MKPIEVARFRPNGGARCQWTCFAVLCTNINFQSQSIGEFYVRPSDRGGRQLLPPEGDDPQYQIRAPKNRTSGRQGKPAELHYMTAEHRMTAAKARS